MSVEADEQLAKYREWAARLEQNIGDMKRQRRSSWLYLLAGIVGGAVTWQFHHFAGGAVVALGIILWSTALYITWMRIWYYQNELARTRAEIDQLSESATPS